MPGKPGRDSFEDYLNTRIEKLEETLREKIAECLLVDGRLQAFEEIRAKAHSCKASPGFAVRLNDWAKECEITVERLRAEQKVVEGAIQAFKRSLEYYPSFCVESNSENNAVKEQIKRLELLIDKHNKPKEI